jgi:hypothetical protein
MEKTRHTIYDHSNIPEHAQALRVVLPANPAALRFCWHIRVGMYRKTDVSKIHDYAKFFFSEYLKKHLEDEAKMVLAAALHPVMIKRTLAIHRRLQRLFEEPVASYRLFCQMEDKLEEFVRFEQKVLYMELQTLYEKTDFKMLIGNLREHDREFLKKTCRLKDMFWELK